MPQKFEYNLSLIGELPIKRQGLNFHLQEPICRKPISSLQNDNFYPIIS